MDASTVRAPLTPQRRRRASRNTVENDEFIKFAMRILRSLTARIGGGEATVGDIEALADMVRLRKAVDEAIVQAVTRLRAGSGSSNGGYSWAEIGRVLGMTRQAAQEKYTPRPEGQPKRVRNRGRQSVQPTQIQSLNQKETA